MTRVTLFGLNETVEFDENETFEYETSCGDLYERAAYTTDDRLIAFDEAVGEWVQLG